MKKKDLTGRDNLRVFSFMELKFLQGIVDRVGDRICHLQFF